MDTHNFIEKSLELHLFFGRIMKEHSLFLRAGFAPANTSFSKRAEFFKREFERLLNQAISLSKGIISPKVLCSGELVTEFTEKAEQQTERFTGIPIDKNITVREERLISMCSQCKSCMDNFRQVKFLNRKAISLLNGLISFKEEILRNVLRCNMFTMNYPLLIEHIIREAKLYREYVQILEKSGKLSCESMKETECFWNQIMMEHALFIRGLLDPSEKELFQSADSFVKDYSLLLESCNNAHSKTLTPDSLEETIKFRDFKSVGAKGIQECKIRSVILPLLADHVLREANHYIRLLKN